MLKSNSKMIMLCGGGERHHLVTYEFDFNVILFLVSLQFLSQLNNIFHVKGLTDLLLMSN